MGAIGMPPIVTGPPKPKPVVTKEKIKPLKPMMALHWNRIVLPTRDLETHKTIWRRLDTVPIDESTLCELFAKKQSAKAGKSGGSGKLGSSKKSKKPKKRTALSGKTSKAVGILLKRALPDIPIIIKNLTSMVNFTEDHLEKIMKNMPTTDDIQMLQAEEKAAVEPIKWAEPEMYFLALSKIPMLRQRLDCWMFSLQMDERVSNANRQLKLIIDACQEIRTNDRLKTLISGILSLGNYMNGGKKGKERADGFDVKDLAKVSASKSVDNKSNLLKYLVGVVVAKDPAFRDIKAEFKGLYGTRSSPDLADVSGAATGLVTNFKRRQKTAELVAKKPIEGGSAPDNFQSYMLNFFDANEKRLEELEKLVKKANADYKECFAWFGDGQKQGKVMKASDFFNSFLRFLDDVVKSMPKKEKKVGAKIGLAKGKSGGKGGPMGAVISSIKKSPLKLKGKKKKGLPPGAAGFGKIDLSMALKKRGKKKS